MASQLFAGFVYTGAGVAVNGATVDLLDRNTTTPVRATTTTNASGYWTISHATEGRFDVRITNGTSITFLKYDDQIQVEGLETATLRVRNPADTFDYDIVPEAITADRQLNLPLLTATDTLAVLALAQTFLTGVKTFNSSILAIRNPADTFSYTLVASAITAARNLTIPLTTADDTLVVLALAQTLTNKTLTSPTINTPTIPGTEWANANHGHAAANSGGQVALSDTTGTLAVARGGTGLTALGTGSQVLRTNAGATALEYATLASGPAQATQAAIEAETNEDTYIPPDLLRKSPGVAKAWCRIDGSGLLESPSYNVSSVTDTAVGDATVNFTTAFSTAVYTALATIGANTNRGDTPSFMTFGTGSVLSLNRRNDDNAGVHIAGVLEDRARSCVFYGDQ